MSKNLVIYHDNCMDGFAAAWAASKFLPKDSTIFAACNYGQSPPAMISGMECIYIVDFSFPRETLVEMCRFAKNVVVLDHHKTAQEALSNWFDKPANLCIEFNMHNSGARITWDYFAARNHASHNGLYVPLLIDYVEDRDLWKFSLQHSKEINAYIANIPKSFPNYEEMNRCLGYKFEECQRIGAHLLLQHQTICEQIANDAREITLHISEKEGSVSCAKTYTGLASNCTGQFASEVGNLLAIRSGTFGATYCSSKDGAVKWSLRSCEDYDVSNIAKHFGGGGHKNAAGFTLYANEDLNMYRNVIDIWKLDGAGS